MNNYTKNYINQIEYGLRNSTYNLNGNKLDSEEFFNKLNEFVKRIKANSGRIFFFGNGASAAFSNHMALDWSKNGGILAISLSDSAMLTALANDYNYNDAFLEFFKINCPTINDLVVTTSSSGNSKNVVNVLEFCRQRKITTFGLSGLNEGNKTQELADFSLYVPMKTYGMVECIHQVFHHIFLDKYMNIFEWEKTVSQNMDVNNFKL